MNLSFRYFTISFQNQELTFISERIEYGLRTVGIAGGGVYKQGKKIILLAY